MNWKLKLDRLKYWVRNQILKLAIKYIRYYSKDSNYIKHANSEYQFAYGDYKSDNMQSYMCEQVNDLLALLSTQGDSGFSISYKLSLLNKMIKFEPISPLTFEDDEFNEPFTYYGTRQNKRYSSVFKNKDGSFNYIYSYNKYSKWKIGEELEIVEGSHTNWSGSCFTIDKDGKIGYLGRDKIKDIKNWNKQSFQINTYEIEFPKDWWISFVKTEDLKDYLEIYEPIDNDPETAVKMLNKEIYEFKNGIYTEDILKRIQIIKKHMYE